MFNPSTNILREGLLRDKDLGSKVNDCSAINNRQHEKENVIFMSFKIKERGFSSRSVQLQIEMLFQQRET